jgi:hypothetical protein
LLIHATIKTSSAARTMCVAIMFINHLLDLFINLEEFALPGLRAIQGKKE